MSNPKNTGIKKFGRLPLLIAAALPLTTGLAFASAQTVPNQTVPNPVVAQAPERVHPSQPGQMPEHGRDDGHGHRLGDEGHEHGGQQRGGLGHRGPRAAIGAAVAKSLGLSETALMQELQGGKTITQVAQAKGVSTVTVHAAAVSALQTQLAADVKAGHIQQAQATQMVQRAQADANFGLEFGRHRGGPRGSAPDGQSAPTRQRNGSNT